jgi:hypothetical protein
MPEPTTTAAATLLAATASVPILTAFGIPLGLRADLLVAGFAGSLVAIILLNSVPNTGDTWRELVRATVRRMFVAIASSLTAGYLTPLALLMAALPEPLVIGAAFAVGGGAQQVLMFAIRRMSGQAAPGAAA